jgi:hypothetical protein
LGWGVTDTGATATTGLQSLGKFSSQAGKDLRNPGLTPAERSLAGYRMRYLSMNQGWADAAQLGRSGAANWAMGGTVLLGGVLTVIGYHAGGDPWWKAIGKGIVATGFSLGGSIVGGIGGAAGGAAIPGPDLTGIPEVLGGIAGAAGGGYIGGYIGNTVANFLFGP